MIIILCGGIGSGKSVTATKFIKNNDALTYGNFKLYNIKKYQRLKYADIIKDGKINWTFWKESLKKHPGFDIVIDEMHNLIHSRRSMSKNNTLLSAFFAQTRKLLGSSEENHLVCISQKTDRIDVSLRDLCNKVIYSTKFKSKTYMKTKVRKNGKLISKMLPRIWIIQYHFTGTTALRRYEAFRDMGIKTYDVGGIRYFVANPYFQYYDSYEIIDFGDETFL